MQDTLTIYHNPRCSKSRTTLALLEEQGQQPEVIQYLKTPPTAAELEKILTMLAQNIGAAVIALRKFRIKQQGTGKIFYGHRWRAGFFLSKTTVIKSHRPHFRAKGIQTHGG